MLPGCVGWEEYECEEDDGAKCPQFIILLLWRHGRLLDEDTGDSEDEVEGGDGEGAEDSGQHNDKDDRGKAKPLGGVDTDSTKQVRCLAEHLLTEGVEEGEEPHSCQENLGRHQYIGGEEN